MTTERPTYCFPCQASSLQFIPTNARPDDTSQSKVYCAAVPIAGLVPQRVVWSGRWVVSEQSSVGIPIEG